MSRGDFVGGVFCRGGILSEGKFVEGGFCRGGVLSGPLFINYMITPFESTARIYFIVTGVGSTPTEANQIFFSKIRIFYFIL